MNIDYNKQLSEEFIREHQEEINWHFISSFQQLSENFIREFQDKVNWISISYYQKLSINFIIEFQYKICWQSLLEKYGYKLYQNNIEFQIDYNNYYSDWLEWNDLKKIVLKLISLKTFQ